MSTMASIEKQLALARRIKNSFRNFSKMGKDNMTEGAALSRIQLHKELWTKFDANHDELLSADYYDGKDDYFAMDMYSQVEEYYLVG